MFLRIMISVAIIGFFISHTSAQSISLPKVQLVHKLGSVDGFFKRQKKRFEDALKNPKEFLTKELEKHKLRIEEEVKSALNPRKKYEEVVIALNGEASEELWGESGRFAYIGAAEIMQTRSPDGELLNEAYKAHLRPYFGGLVDRIIIHWNVSPLDVWTASNFTGLEGLSKQLKNKKLEIKIGRPETQGQTYGYHIYIRGKATDDTFRNRLLLTGHEVGHSHQFVELGESLGNFGYEYFKEFKKANQEYEKNKLEIEAEADANSVLKNHYAEALGFIKAAANQSEPYDRGAVQYVKEHNTSHDDIIKENSVYIDKVRKVASSGSVKKDALNQMHDSVKNAHMWLIGKQDECRVGQHLGWARTQDSKTVGEEIVSQTNAIRKQLR